MTTRSDFAQKLLTDLRVRKERMTAAQHSSRQSSQTSRATRGGSGQTTRGARQMNVPEYTGSTTSRRSNGGSRSSQIVLYESGQSSKQVRDLSMAIAFAFENSGSLSSSSSNPLVNFFNRFGRRSSNSQKMDSYFYNHSAASNIHINEISRGVHKLNQILSACSNGLNLDRNSIEIGRELLKGAVDLEESLRMLVTLQDASGYTKKKSRLKLLDENENENENEDDDEDDHNEKRAEQWKLDRPRFSFDNKTSGSSRALQGTTRQKLLALPYEPSSNLKMVPHMNSASSKSGKEKGRISNVVAKLMGLDELPQKECSIGNVSRESSKQNEALSRESRSGSDLTSNKRLNSKPEKGQATLERIHPRKDYKTQEADTKLAPVVMKKHTNHVNGHKSLEDSMRKQTHGEDKQSKVSNADLQKRAQTRNRIEQEAGANLIERRNVNQPKAHDHHAHIQEQMAKSKRSTAMNSQKKLSRDKSVKPNEKAPTKDPQNRRHQEAEIIIDNSHRTAANQESLKIEGQSHSSSKTESEPQNDMDKGSSKQPLTEEKPIEASATQKRAVTRKVQRREIPEKIELLMTRRNARSIKRPANMLKDLKQQMKSRNQGSSEAKEGREVTSAYNALETAHDKTITSNSIVADEFQDQNKLNLHNNAEEQPSALQHEKELKKCDQNIGKQPGCMQFPSLDRYEQLTEPEKNLKETVIKSQLFLSTAEALFKLNIPASFLHAGDHEKEVEQTKLVLDSAYEVMKRKARRHEVTHQPFIKTAITSQKLRNLDDLVRKLCKDMEILKSYGMNGSDECDVAAGLHRMLNRDIYNENPDVNCMWDLEWSRMKSIFPEMEDVVKDVERHMLNALLDEIASDLLVITVLV